MLSGWFIAKKEIVMRRTLVIWFGCLIVLMAATNSWAENTCSPSKWGENDEIGSANLVTPDQVLMAAKLVTKGRLILWVL